MIGIFRTNIMKTNSQTIGPGSVRHGRESGSGEGRPRPKPPFAEDLDHVLRCWGTVFVGPRWGVPPLLDHRITATTLRTIERTINAKNATAIAFQLSTLSPLWSRDSAPRVVDEVHPDRVVQLEPPWSRTAEPRLGVDLDPAVPDPAADPVLIRTLVVTERPDAP